MSKIKPINILILTTLPLLLGCANKGGFSSSDDSISSSESYIEPSSSEEEEIYDELPDSIDGVDTDDLSALYSAFSGYSSYESDVKTYFNEVGLYDYYRHYQTNYIPESVSLVSEEWIYSYTPLVEYFDSMNEGYLNKNNNYYRFSLPGETIADRLGHQLVDDELTLVKSNARYQDDMFLLNDFTESYLSMHHFTRISEVKYQCTEKDVFNDFVAICAPNLINSGSYMTFSRVTIELLLTSVRIRIYAANTQKGKLIESHREESDKPNWYLLFSEANIYL